MSRDRRANRWRLPQTHEGSERLGIGSPEGLRYNDAEPYPCPSIPSARGHTSAKRKGNVAANRDPQDELVRSTAKALLDHMENTGSTYLTEPEIAEPPGILDALVGGLEKLPVIDHAVPWNFEAWKAGFTLAEGLEDDTRAALVKAASALHGLHGSSIARRNVFDFVNSQDRSEIDGFLAMMAWGHGTTGYGWWRTAMAAASRRGNQCRKLCDRIRAQVEAARRSPQSAFDSWSHKDSRIRFVGPAFASKLAYFAVPDDMAGHRRPLIADDNTAWSFWAFTNITDTRTSREKYESYITVLHGWAAVTELRPDAFERGLFLVGPYVSRVWQGRWRELGQRSENPR